MPAPTFSPKYIKPGPYLISQDNSTPTLPSGTRVPSIVGQGSKTLQRMDTIIKGASGGQDTALKNNIAITVLGLVDINNVVYKFGTDFLLTRTNGGANAVIDWSPLATLTGTVNLTTLTYPGQLDGQTFRINLNGVDYAIVFSAPANAAAVASQINAWVGSTIASVQAVTNFLVLSAKQISIETSFSTGVLGFTVGQYAAVNQPAVGLSYQVTYISDKLPSEYGLQIFNSMNALLAYHGPLNPPTVVATGTAASGAGNNTVTAAGTSPGWTTNAFIGYYLTITGGTGQGQVRVIIANTGNQVTLSQVWNTYNTPDATSTFQISQYNDNSISRGAQIMSLLNVSAFITSQYADNLFDLSNIKPAIDNTKNPIGGFQKQGLVLMRGLSPTSDASIIAYLQAHVDTYSSVLQSGKMCTVAMGLAYGNDSFTSYITTVQSIVDARCVLAGQSEITMNFGVGAGLENLDGSYIAAALIGAYCDSTVDAGSPIIEYSLGAVFDVDTFPTPFDDATMDLMSAAGVLCLYRDGDTIKVRDDLTTNPATAISSKWKFVRMQDFIGLYTLATMKSVTHGKRMVQNPTGGNDLLSTLTAQLAFGYNAMRNPLQQIIAAPVTNLSVVQDPDVTNQIDVTASIALTTDVTWELAVLGYTVG